MRKYNSAEVEKILKEIHELAKRIEQINIELEGRYKIYIESRKNGALLTSHRFKLD